ncbi:hypothetical protein [Paenibacillus sp. KS-LC4]|uniref:hypothetical protein n=1 Tax=Paenibacillus sp. KS-LC4 TaxID=2979727 RepID=UPI0030D0B28E
MEIIKIHYPVPLNEIEDINNDNIDVFVELEDGFNYSVVVITPLNLLWYMNKEGKGYIPAAPPKIIVNSLTEDNIRDALISYAKDNAFWLKLIFLSYNREISFNMEQMNQSLQIIHAKNKELLME